MEVCDDIASHDEQRNAAFDRGDGNGFRLRQVVYAGCQTAYGELTFEAVRSSQQHLLSRSVQLAGNRTKPASLHRLNVRPMACAAFASTPQAHEIGTYQAELKDRHCHAMNALALVVDNAHNGVAEACVQIVRPVCTGRRAQ
jgi:hypothetical protein